MVFLQVLPQGCSEKLFHFSKLLQNSLKASGLETVPLCESLNPAHRVAVYALSLCFPCASFLRTKIHHLTLDLSPLPLWNRVVMTEVQSYSCFTSSPVLPPPKASVSPPPGAFLVPQKTPSSAQHCLNQPQKCPTPTRVSSSFHCALWSSYSNCLAHVSVL